MTQEHENDGDMVCDVLVVGFGAAGACAALEAVDQDAKVIIADRFCGGGASVLSGDVFYAGGGTAVQKKIGIKDSVEAMMDYLSLEIGSAVAPETLARFCRESAANLQWLQSHGLRFGTKLYTEKTSYPPRRTDLYFSGNEAVPRFAARARAAPRGHIATSLFHRVGGGGFYKPLKKSVQKSEAKIIYHACATKLIEDKNDHIIGIEFAIIPAYSLAAALHRLAAKGFHSLRFYIPALAHLFRRLTCWLELHYAQTKRIKAKKAVILASGGFIFNKEMVRHHAPQYRKCMALGAMGCDGSAVRLASAVGAAEKHMAKISAWRFINPPRAWIFGVLVNQHGARICDESLYGAAIGQILCEQNEGRAFLILDQTLYRKAWRQIFFGRARLFQIMQAFLEMTIACQKANDLDSLSKKCSFDSATLTNTIENYTHAASDSTREDAFGKDRRFLHPFDGKGYYAINVSVTQPIFPCPAISLGGVAVDEESGRVCHSDGSIIAGLYAAGRAASGIVSHSYVSGLSLADCVFSGRRAAQHATRTKIEEKDHG